MLKEKEWITLFTGIVEEVGIIKRLTKESPHAWELTIQAAHILEDVQLGDSISVNGICLTVTSFNSRHFTVDVMPETARSTSLQSLRHGSQVNLERAMSGTGRFGGHFVSGHIDGVGEIIKRIPVENAIYYDIKVPEQWMTYIVPKGSIAVDGTSLTVFAIEKDSFQISLIPHTRQQTILGEKKVGDVVNIECDLLVKSLAHIVKRQATDKQLDQAFLQENGFM